MKKIQVELSDQQFDSLKSLSKESRKSISEIVIGTLEPLLSINVGNEMRPGQDENEHIFEVIIEPDEDVFHAYCPVLKGCRTWGHTKEEALKFIQEAVELYIEDLIDDGKPIPGLGLVKNIKPLVRVKELEEASI
jgi:predicted RNase H-like HicB family nuclease